MSEIDKICTHFKITGKVGNAGKPLFACEARGLVLGDTAKVCFVCDEYKASKSEFDSEIRQDIVDYLSGKRKRQTKRWTKAKGAGTGKGTTKRGKGEEYEEEEEEGEMETESDEIESEDTEEEDLDVESETEGDAESDEEEEEEDGSVVVKKPVKASKTKPAKPVKPLKGKKEPKPSASAPVAVDLDALGDEAREVLLIVKGSGAGGITQYALKDETDLASAKITKAINELKDAGLITKEAAKAEDKRGRKISTSLLTARE